MLAGCSGRSAINISGTFSGLRDGGMVGLLILGNSTAPDKPPDAQHCSYQYCLAQQAKGSTSLVIK